MQINDSKVNHTLQINSFPKTLLMIHSEIWKMFKKIWSQISILVANKHQIIVSDGL